MTVRRAPAAATWFLKLFCSKPEHEALIGDLAEQYQFGRGRFWYWKQVLAIVFLGLCRNTRRSLASAPRNRIAQGSALTFFFALLAAALLSEISVLALVGILGGAGMGIFMFLRGETPGSIRASRTKTDEATYHPGISMHHIPAEGAAGFLFVFATVFIFGVGVPAIRAMLVFIAPAGILGAGVLFHWHKRHPVKIQALDLHEQKQKP